MSGLTMGSLFAGIGGFDLGFERAGFKTLWEVEIDPYCRKVLEKNFPHAERFKDVRECGAHNLRPVDVICGGFPCQDISNAGLRAGIDGERSGLWREFARIIGELRPKFVVVENVAALLGRGMGRVLGDLSALGYDAEWEVISAADAGAPHLRERIWIVAYPERDQLWEQSRWGCGASRTSAVQPGDHGPEESMANAHSDDKLRWRGVVQMGRISGQGETANDGDSARTQWSAEPNVGRVAHGVPSRVDRLKALGNSVVPQIPEMIAKRIAELLA